MYTECKFVLNPRLMAQTQLTTRSKVSVGIAAVALVGLGAYGFAVFLQDQNSQPIGTSNTSPAGSTPATETLDSCLFKCSYAEGFCLSDRYQKPENCATNRQRCEGVCRDQYLADTRVATVRPEDAQMNVDVRTNPSTPGATVRPEDGQMVVDTRTALTVYQISTNSPLPQGEINRPYQFQLVAANIPNGTTATWSKDEFARLPNGITLSSNGILGGIPTEAGVSRILVRVTSPTGHSDWKELFLSILPPPAGTNTNNVVTGNQTGSLTITTNATLSGGQVGRPYSVRLTSDRPAPNHEVLWYRTAGRLPAGLDFSMQDGTISGTPLETGVATFEVRAENSLNYVGTKTFSLTITAASRVVSAPNINPDTFITNPIQPSTVAAPELAILTTSLTNGTIRQPYSVQLIGNIPAGLSSWAVTQDRLHDGLGLSSEGFLTGTPIEDGDAQFRVRLTGPSGFVEKVFTLHIAHADAVVVPGLTVLKVSPVDMPVGTVGQSYRQQLATVEGQSLSYWSTVGNVALAPGLALTKDGLISGTPTHAGRFTFSIRGTDSLVDAQRTAYAMRDYVLVIEAAQPSLVRAASSPFPDGVVGQSYRHFPLAVSGGSQPYVWRIDGTERLQEGLTLNQVTGVVSGTPTEGGISNFSIRVNDAAGASVTQNYTLKVAAASVTPVTPDPVIPGTITPESVAFSLVTINSFPNGTVGDSYSHRPMIVSGGKEPYTWTMTGTGRMPDGLSLESSGAVTGVPTSAGVFNVTIQARDAAAKYLSASFTVTINPRAQYVQTYTSDPQWPQRVNVINDLGMRVHDLIKLVDDNDPNTQYDTTVYYVGADGRRHAFPNPKVYFSWFSDYANVRIIGSRQLANIPLGANITYRPGVRLVKFLTDPKVYAVDTQRRLRWIASERAAFDLYGDYWNRNVDDISDAFYMDYRFDAPSINSRSDFDPDRARRSASFPSEVLP